MSYSVSTNGILFLEKWEGFIPHPYQKKGDIPTIGIGTTFYPGGTKVTMSDPSITHDKAVEYASWYMNTLVIPTLNNHVNVALNQNQVDALADFIYNEGTGKVGEPGGFIGSHLLVQINANAGQASIAAEFNKWIYVNHQPNDWQIKRRAAEVSLYFS